MRTRSPYIILCILLMTAIAVCSKKKEQQRKVIRPKPEFQMSQPNTSDRQPNGGMLRYTLAGQVFEDDYFVAMFTPRGDIFRKDNLQLFNYNIGSDKFPQFIISIDNVESDLSLWQNKTFPLNFCSLTAVKNTLPLNSEGEVTLTKITQSAVEGSFSGNMINIVKKKKFPIKGEFRAIIQVNL